MIVVVQAQKIKTGFYNIFSHFISTVAGVRIQALNLRGNESYVQSLNPRTEDYGSIQESLTEGKGSVQLTSLY